MPSRSLPLACHRAALLALLAPLLLLLCVATPVRADSILVNTTADTTDPCAISGTGTCSLRDAVALANATVSATNDFIIAFDETAFPPGTPETIRLTNPGGTLLLTGRSGVTTIDGTGHSVVVDGGCTVNGSGQCTTGGVEVLQVQPGVTARITALTIQHGNAAPDGGGIFNGGGMLTLTGDTLANNTANLGGGIFTNGGTLTVTNSTFSGNSASDLGGGIENGSTLTVTNSTFSGNTASGGGGISLGNAQPATLTNTVVANTASGGDLAIAGGGAFTGTHNLIDDAAHAGGFTDGTNGNIVGHPALLASALAANGGPTQTLAPLSGSPGVGAGDPAVCRQVGPGMVNAVDQRDLPRLASTCDIGAYQLQGTHLSVGLSGGAAGTAVTLIVVLLDGYGNTLAPYTGTVHLTGSDPLATLPADYAFTGSGKDNGVHVFLTTFRSAGTQRVTVADTLAGTLTNQATTAITPVVGPVSPASGSTAGGNRVTLTGQGFGASAANVAVSIGGVAAPIAGVTNAQLVVTAPAHAAGAVDVAVTVNGQSTTVTNGYTYGVVNPVSNPRPPGGAGGSANPLPTGRTPGAPQGGTPPSPLPNSRP